MVVKRNDSPSLSEAGIAQSSLRYRGGSGDEDIVDPAVLPWSPAYITSTLSQMPATTPKIVGDHDDGGVELAPSSFIRVMIWA